MCLRPFTISALAAEYEGIMPLSNPTSVASTTERVSVPHVARKPLNKPVICGASAISRTVTAPAGAPSSPPNNASARLWKKIKPIELGPPRARMSF